MPQVVSPRFHVLELGQSVYPAIPAENLSVSSRHFRLALAVAKIAAWTRHACSPAVTSVSTIARAAPGLVLVVFAHPACVAADFTRHLNIIFAQRKPH